MADTCQPCGRRISPAMRLCPDCGARNPDYAPPVAVAPPPAAEPYTPGSDLPADAVAGGPALYPRAPLAGRFFAWVFDGIVAGLPLVPGSVMLGMAVERGMRVRDGAGLTPALVACAMGVAWGGWYALTKDGRPRGQSVGKRMMGLMVVHLATDRPCSKPQSAARALVLALTGIVPLLGWAVEPLALSMVVGGRRLGDVLAGTQVIEVADYGPDRA